ncbi:MAG TPA: SRPBCC domain-containing protein [Bryobacteraceae bacterium]|jgi:uncharacterized protein YndB with AHSA1/START domain|nr:SRPBCC domain-containing protein [Bryobacteraceae bacterium]
MIQKSVLLRCPPDKAFRLFTESISEWWPKTHRPTKDPESQLFLEPAGRFWERSRDGREMELGRVLTWEPPRRLALDFYVGTNAAQPTALEVTFTAEGVGTRVTVDHRAKPESEDLWALRAPVFEKSWEAVLTALANR